MYDKAPFPCLACLLALAVALAMALPAQAALTPRNQATAAEGFNPTPAADDIILPMPCQGQMAFKLVAVPAKGFLQDMPTRLGRDDTANAERGYYDNRYSTALAAPFTLNDLPAEWRARAPRGEYRYYLVQKYELSTLQWDTVMAESCPNLASVATEAVRPKTEISWYDATAFGEKYTAWLLREHPASLPRFAHDERNVGYVRLPTEVEWEYAARGGHKTDSQWLAQEDFFPLPEGANLTNYAVFRPENAARIEEHPQRIGSRQPNNLGLYDTAGNVAEMVLDSFRFSLGGRLHGSAGGFVRKGGSYLSGTAEIMPGRREEVAFFQQNGPTRARDLGVRLVISGINTPAGDRPAALKAEWEKAGEGFNLATDASRTPLQTLDALIAQARTDVEKQNLQQLRTVIKDHNIALERQQMQAAESLVRTAVFIAEAMRNYDKRITITDFLLQEKHVSREQARTLHNNLRQGLRKAAGLYYAKIHEATDYPQDLFAQALKNVKADIAQSQQGKFDKRVLTNLRTYEGHVKASQRGRTPDLETVTRDILKEQ